MATRYQRGNQNLYIEEDLTTQWPKDTKGVIRFRISKKNWQHNGQKISKLILITRLISCGHCVVCSSSIYRFWLPLWYLVAIALSALLRYRDDDYPFGIFWPLCRLLIFDIQILITHLVSCGHCVVCFSSIYRFSLPLLYLVAIVSSALLRYTDSDYPFGILWPLCRLLFFDLQILITPLVSCGHCVVCSSSIYRFWLPLWYILAIVLSVLLRYTDSDDPFGIFWPLCCHFLTESVYRRREDNTMDKRYQRGNQNLYIEEEQTTQWPKYTKGVIIICISKKSRRNNSQNIPKG
jgi:hypothetical protein